jgi:putative membrane protein
MRYDWNDGHMDDDWGIAMMLSMLGFWALITAVIVFAIVWSVRSTRTAQGAPPAPLAPPATGATSPGGVTTTAEQILAERLARGEIDPEEYRTRVEALGSRSER